MASISKSLEAPPQTPRRECRTRDRRALRVPPELLEQALEDVALAGFRGWRPCSRVADLGLADAVDAAEALLQPVGVPREVVVDHQVGVLQVHAFARRVGGDAARAPRGRRNSACTLRRSSLMTPPWITTTASSLPIRPRIFTCEVVQRVAVLGEDDELALAGVACISGVFCRQAGQLIPLAVLTRSRRPAWPVLPGPSGGLSISSSWMVCAAVAWSRTFFNPSALRATGRRFPDVLGRPLQRSGDGRRQRWPPLFSFFVLDAALELVRRRLRTGRWPGLEARKRRCNAVKPKPTVPCRALPTGRPGELGPSRSP